jgi:peptidoglycan hydrolase FlgJ
MAFGAAHSPTALSSSAALAADVNALGKLKLQAGKSGTAAIQETAKQFEAMFMRELLKSMRDATLKSGMLDNAGSDLGTDLLDQQFAVAMSGQPGGLSDLIAQQLTRQMGLAAGSADAKIVTPPTPVDAAKSSDVKPSDAQARFVDQHSQTANDIERATGIPASYLLGQAGHETGWGRREIKTAEGGNSFNLFGIKAGGNWKGKVAEITTTEYANGAAQKQVAQFRAYDSYHAAFKDYARLITDSPRYAQVMRTGTTPQSFASGLQRAGYATDPAYADKLSRAINTTLQLRRVQA